MADESGDRGEGGWGGRGDFGGWGGGADEPTVADFERAMDRMAEEQANLAAERAAERPGRFGFTTATSFRAPESELFGYTPSWKDRVLNTAKRFGIQTVTNYLRELAPGPMPTALTMGGLLYGKLTGKTAQELEDQALAGIIGTIAPWGAGVVALGKGLDRFAGWAGAAPRPASQATIGDTPTGPGLGVNPEDVAFDRSEFARRPAEQLLRRARTGRVV